MEHYLRENQQLKITLEGLRNDVRRLLQDRNILQERIQTTFDTIDKENHRLKRNIEELTFEVEAAKREKKSLVDRLNELSMGKLALPILSTSLSGSAMVAAPPAAAAAAEVPAAAIPEEEGLIWEHKHKLEIKAGTKEKLVAKLYTPSDYHSIPEFATTFLLTYRSFMKPKEVLDLLQTEFDRSLPAPGMTDETREELSKRRIRICNFIRRWVESFYHDFERDTELIEGFHHFVENINQIGEEVDKSLANLMDKAMKRKLANETLARQLLFDRAPPAPIVPANVSIETLEPIEIARQLTLIEHDMFRTCAPKELLNLSWQSKEKETLSPNVLKMIRRFNDVSSWVTCCVVSEPNLKKRQAIMKKFIRTAEECCKLNNFNAIFEITSGLSNSAVFRLHKTWEAVRGKDTFWTHQEKITSSRNNFKYYKELLHNCSPPCVPYLGVYLSSLTFIEDGNPNVFPENNYINFFKRRLVSEVIREITQYQQAPYNLVAVPSIVQYFADYEKPMHEVFKMSLSIEPRE
eukprot:TRINITY_DN2861_c0_g1_i4.p1 TRINITY_DN2861_c0_g1~~TRINITY_DN2861_c0_g1_i4.p1  ORF type:complete len:521 (+),score=136.05 TRINITY_DN2861_c0_g1_i4:171-1733(+)